MITSHTSVDLLICVSCSVCMFRDSIGDLPGLSLKFNSLISCRFLDYPQRGCRFSVLFTRVLFFFFFFLVNTDQRPTGTKRSGCVLRQRALVAHVMLFIQSWLLAWVCFLVAFLNQLVVCKLIIESGRRFQSIIVRGRKEYLQTSFTAFSCLKLLELVCREVLDRLGEVANWSGQVTIQRLVEDDQSTGLAPIRE